MRFVGSHQKNPGSFKWNKMKLNALHHRTQATTETHPMKLVITVSLCISNIFVSGWIVMQNNPVNMSSRVLVGQQDNEGKSGKVSYHHGINTEACQPRQRRMDIQVPEVFIERSEQF